MSGTLSGGEGENDRKEEWGRSGGTAMMFVKSVTTLGLMGSPGTLACVGDKYDAGSRSEGEGLGE
jgi:hypothetical protein